MSIFNFEDDVTSVEGDFERFWTNHMKPFISSDVELILKSFFRQFDSKFGAQALAAALGAVGSLALPGASFADVATGLASTLYVDAKTDAASTAELDAKEILQTVQSALQVAKAVNNVVTPADQATATAIATPISSASVATASQ